MCAQHESRDFFNISKEKALLSRSRFFITLFEILFMQNTEGARRADGRDGDCEVEGSSIVHFFEILFLLSAKSASSAAGANERRRRELCGWDGE